MKRDRYKTSIAFIDLLFNITIGITMLFIIAFLLINPIAKKGDIIINAEFVITLSWPHTSKDDIDLYVQDPTGNVVFFKQKDVGLMNLDRDDLGDRNDVVLADGMTFVNELNEEHVTIRGIVPGEYVVNAHWYSKTSKQIAPDGKLGTEYVPSASLPVTIKVEKLNPYKLVFTGQKEITYQGEEITFIRFTIDEDGNVVAMNKLKKQLTGQSVPDYGATGTGGPLGY